MRGTERQKIISLLLACALLLCAAPRQTAATQTGFPDVADDAWYEQPILLMQNYTPGIINGIVDSDGVTRFHPDGAVKRGEFLKMMMTAAEGYTVDRSRDEIHWAGRYYTIAEENNILIADYYTDSGAAGQTGTGTELLFPCTPEALDEPITRYEMAVILSNTCTQMLRELTAVTNLAYSNITDYSYIDPQYVSAVEQAFGKGLLSGYEDGSFRGDRSLSRAEAAVVIYRMLWANDRVVPDWSRTPDGEMLLRTKRPQGFQSFAEWLVQGNHLDRYNNIDAEARERLFGDPNKYYFKTMAEAEPYIEAVTLPVWGTDRSGIKYETSVTINVNKCVAEEVRLIFAQIFDDPEQYCMAGAVGGGRFTGETMRHAWGCAIDINATYNCECNFSNGSFTPTCGYGWWPIVEDEPSFRWAGRSLSAYHGSLGGPSQFSISPTGSVVKAFNDYGWGWGGSGSNIPGEGDGWGGGNNFDFMHFSVRPDGG